MNVDVTRKPLCLLLVIFVSSLFVGCRSYTEKIVPIKLPNYKPKDYVTKSLSVYEPEESLFPILDSIIIKTEECPDYQNRKEKVFFYFTIENGDPFGDEPERNDPRVGIFVNYYPFRFSNFCFTEGVFPYKGYDFYVEKKSVDILLKESDKKVSIRCVSPEKFHFDPLYRGDRDMYWWYRYENGLLINIQYGYCYIDDF